MKVFKRQFHTDRHPCIQMFKFWLNMYLEHIEFSMDCSWWIRELFWFKWHDGYMSIIAAFGLAQPNPISASLNWKKALHGFADRQLFVWKLQCPNLLTIQHILDACHLHHIKRLNNNHHPSLIIKHNTGTLGDWIKILVRLSLTNTKHIVSTNSN